MNQVFMDAAFLAAELSLE